MFAMPSISSNAQRDHPAVHEARAGLRTRRRTCRAPRRRACRRHASTISQSRRGESGLASPTIGLARAGSRRACAACSPRPRRVRARAGPSSFSTSSRDRRAARRASTSSTVITVSISARTALGELGPLGGGERGGVGNAGCGLGHAGHLPLYDGRALLGEGLRAFLGVLAREDLPADRVLVLHRVEVAHVLGLAPRPQDRLRRQRRVLRDLLRDDLARRRARAPSGTTRPMSPICCASSAGIGAAREQDVHRDACTGSGAGAGTPNRRAGTGRAWLPTRRRSRSRPRRGCRCPAGSRCRPRPRSPRPRRSAASTGGSRAAAPSSAGCCRGPSRPAPFGSSDCWPIATRSTPEQKLPPAPVRIAQRTSGVVVDVLVAEHEPGEHVAGERVLLLGPVHREDHDARRRVRRCSAWW